MRSSGSPAIFFQNVDGLVVVFVDGDPEVLLGSNAEAAVGLEVVSSSHANWIASSLK